MNIGLGIGIPFTRSSLWASIFTPSALFLDGSTQGVWYDPSDINLAWRRNLLTYTEQFDNAAWTKSGGTVVTNSTVAPDGTLTADTVTLPTGGAGSQLYSSVPITSGPVTVSVYLKASAPVSLSFGFYDGAIDVTIVNVTTFWQRFTLTRTAGLTSADRRPCWIYNGIAGSVTFDIWGAQLEVGSTSTEYQRITDGIQDYLQYQAQPVLYQDAAGTTPVTAVEQPVGLMLDKSKGLVLGSNLAPGNGEFNSAGGWTTDANWSISNGSANTLNAPVNSHLYSTEAVLTVGKIYLITFTISGATAGAVRPYAGSRAGSTYGIDGTYSLILDAAGSGVIRFFTVGVSTTISIDNVSYREIPGNHAFNHSGNSANFPVLSARYNLLTKTEDISAADWTKAGTVTASTSSLLETATTGAHSCYLSPTTVAATYIYSVKLKANGRTRLAIAGTSSFGGNLGSGVFFDLSTGSYVSGATGTPSITALADGWYQVSYTWTAFAASGVLGIFLVDSGTNISYAGDVTKGVLIKEADLRVANDALNQPAYQRVNTSTDYDTVGFKPYVRFNGVNQWLQTNSIDFSYSDKMFVCAGVRKLLDASYPVLAEISTSWSANNGTFTVGGGDPNGYVFGSRGAVSSPAIVSGYVAPITSVLSGIGNISGDQSILRINGTQAAISTADQGTGNYGNYPLYIGARAGSSLWFNGRLYGMVVAGKQASASEISSTETYLNQKTGAY